MNDVSLTEQQACSPGQLRNYRWFLRLRLLIFSCEDTWYADFPVYEYFCSAARRFCRKVRFLGQNPKIGYQKFNDLQTAKLSKKQLCDRTHQCLDRRIPDEATLKRKLRPGNTSATRSRRLLIGAFLSPMRVTNSNDSIHHFHRDGVLAVPARNWKSARVATQHVPGPASSP